MNQQQELLEILLEDRPAEFKAKVMDIVYRHQLDPDDPNLQILIATGQLEVLLMEMPETLQAIAEELRTIVNERVSQPWQISFQIHGAWQIAAFGMGLAIVFGSLGIWGGWWAKSAQVYQHYSPAQLEYLDRLWQINSDRLLRCQQQVQKHCQIQLTPAAPQATGKNE